MADQSNASKSTTRVARAHAKTPSTRRDKPRVQPPESPTGGLPDLKLDSLSTLLGFHVRMAQAHMGRRFLDAFAEYSLTQKQHAVLLILRDNPGTQQTQLANELVTDRATMIAMIDRLQERGLLTRERSKVDRRRQDLQLTPQGLALLDEVAGVRDAHELQFDRKFTPAERGLLMEFLVRLYN